LQHAGSPPFWCGSEHFQEKKTHFFFFKLVLYICEMRAGAGMRSEGVCAAEVCFGYSVNHVLEGTSLWWLQFIMCKVGIIITYVKGVLQDLIN